MKRNIMIASMCFVVSLLAHSIYVSYEVKIVNKEMKLVNGNRVSYIAKKENYFPTNIFDEKDDYVTSWYSENLLSMKEISLVEFGKHYDECYRFLWLRSFNNPISIKVWRSGNKKYMVVKELNGAGGYEPGDLIISSIKFLDNKDWVEILNLLDRANYWRLPTYLPDRAVVESDGAQWIFEATKNGTYHFVDRHSPKNDTYADLCLFLLNLAKQDFDISAKDIY